MAFEAGDLYTYTPSDRWCRHGLAIILSDGKPFDTYWVGFNLDPFGREHGALWHEDYVSQLTPENRICNVSELRKSYREEAMLYLDSDTVYLPVGGGSEQWYIKSVAKPDAPKSIEYKTYKMERAISSASHETRKAERLREEIEAIQNQLAAQ